MENKLIGAVGLVIETQWNKLILIRYSYFGWKVLQRRFVRRWMVLVTTRKRLFSDVWKLTCVHLPFIFCMYFSKAIKALDHCLVWCNAMLEVCIKVVLFFLSLKFHIYVFEFHELYFFQPSTQIKTLKLLRLDILCNLNYTRLSIFFLKHKFIQPLFT